MIPIRDNNPTRTKPIVTWVFIAVNVAVFLYQLSVGQEGGRVLVERFGVVPAYLTSGDFGSRTGGGSLGSFITPFTSMFMHGGFLHLAGNMWFLHIFGDNVEDVLGRVRYVIFYLLAGLGAALAQILVGPSSTMPMVGASGAISGVLAGYVMLFPRARVVTLVPIFIFLQFMELPAFLFIFVWFGIQVLSGYVSLGAMDATGGGVAWFAHIGGFVVGLALIRILRPRVTRGPRRDLRPRFDARDYS